MLGCMNQTCWIHTTHCITSLHQQENVYMLLPFGQLVAEPAALCIQTFSCWTNRLYNGLYRVNGVLSSMCIIVWQWISDTGLSVCMCGFLCHWPLLLLIHSNPVRESKSCRTSFNRLQRPPECNSHDTLLILKYSLTQCTAYSHCHLFSDSTGSGVDLMGLKPNP